MKRWWRRRRGLARPGSVYDDVRPAVVRWEQLNPPKQAGWVDEGPQPGESFRPPDDHGMLS